MAAQGRVRRAAGFDGRLAVVVRRMREWADWERQQASGMLGYPPTCELRKGSSRPAGSVVPWVRQADRDALEVARVLAELRGTAAYSWGEIFAWMVETAAAGSVAVSLRGGSLFERLREAQDQEPEIRDQAAALLASQWYRSPGASAGWWAAQLGVSEDQVRALHDAALMRVGEVLDRDTARWRPWGSGQEAGREHLAVNLC